MSCKQRSVINFNHIDKSYGKDKIDEITSLSKFLPFEVLAIQKTL